MNSDPLPSSAMSPTTETVAYFQAPTVLLADWLLGELSQGGSIWVRQELIAPNPEARVRSLFPLADIGVTRYLLLRGLDSCVE